jgi:hypothetical protein
MCMKQTGVAIKFRHFSTRTSGILDSVPKKITWPLHAGLLLCEQAAAVM